MIFILNILIDLLLIFAVWRIFKFSRKLEASTVNCYNQVAQEHQRLVASHNVLGISHNEHRDESKNAYQQIRGILSEQHIKYKLAEKIADRAFNMASSANLGVVALQKALAVPRLLTKEQGQRNELAKQNIDALFSGGDALDFLKPIATEEELLAIEKIQEDKRRQMLNGNKNT